MASFGSKWLYGCLGVYESFWWLSMDFNGFRWIIWLIWQHMAHDGSKAYAGSVLNLFNAMFPLSDLFCQNRFFLLHGMEFSKHTKFFKICLHEAEKLLTSGAKRVQKCRFTIKILLSTTFSHKYHWKRCFSKMQNSTKQKSCSLSSRLQLLELILAAVQLYTPRAHL